MYIFLGITRKIGRVPIKSWQKNSIPNFRIYASFAHFSLFFKKFRRMQAYLVAHESMSLAFVGRYLTKITLSQIEFLRKSLRFAQIGSVEGRVWENDLSSFLNPSPRDGRENRSQSSGTLSRRSHRNDSAYNAAEEWRGNFIRFVEWNVGERHRYPRNIIFAFHEFFAKRFHLERIPRSSQRQRWWRERREIVAFAIIAYDKMENEAVRITLIIVQPNCFFRDYYVFSDCYVICDKSQFYL